MRKDFKVEIEIDEKDFTATGTVDFITESNYGADADGNRGIEKTYIDDWDIVEVVDSEGKTVDLTVEMFHEIREKLLELNEGAV